MPMPLQKFREIVFQTLYSIDMGHASEADMIPFLMNELETTKKVIKTAQDRVRQILEKKSEIDALITKTSQSYEFERIQNVERNILRLGVFELLFDNEIPEKVAISEAVRLSRKFGTPESASFVNAILDSIYKSSKGEEVNTSKINQSLEELEKSEQLAKKAIEDSIKSKKSESNENS